MLERGKLDRGIMEMVDLEGLVPKEHLLRKIDAAVDFSELYQMVEELYSEEQGRPSVDSVVLFKMVLIQHLYGLGSLRRTADEVSLNVAYRWFLGYPLQEETPHFSSLMIFDRHANLKYKYGNRQFWCTGYYVDTVGRNKKAIREYIWNQLQEDIVSDQISLKEYIDPFTGEQAKQGK